MIMIMMNRRKLLSLLLLLFFITLPVLVHSECTCDMEEEEEGRNKPEALKLKFIAIASILLLGATGVCIPIFGNLNPDKYIFIMIKAFAAGVILSTGCMHVLADAIENLNSPCLNQDTWGYPWAIFIMMMSILITFMLDKFATSYYNRSHFINKEEGGLPLSRDQEHVGEHAGHVHVHTHATHGHSHGSALLSSDADVAADLIRHRVVSKVLELGIAVHSIIIGISLGTSQSPSTIKPLIAALTFHQFFEGLGLGGCISQAELKKTTVTSMVVFFSLITPIGIGIGIGISNVYKENSPISLIVEGIFNAVSSGILICMALVDLLAADFANPKLQSNGRLQIIAFISVFLGAGCMALLAKWA